MRRLLRIFLLLLLVAGGVGGYGAHRALKYLDAPIDAQGGETRVEIPKGAHFREVVRLLADAGLVRDPLVFEWYGRYLKAERGVKAGVYAIDRAMTPRTLLEELRRGALPEQVLVTLPEGYNRWQIADALSKAGVADRAAFLAHVERDDLEGRLFPDTYWIKKGATLDEVVRLLTGHFEAVFDEVVKGHPEEAKLRSDPVARRRLLIIASLVEKEAKTEEDRPLIARVFENRLQRGMKLETDPTCVYGADIYQEVPHPRFCRDASSRYSTYVISGLPPTPIANPGRASLVAALRPATGERAEKLLYFVAKRDGTGAHHFSETFGEHDKAVDRFLRQR